MFGNQKLTLLRSKQYRSSRLRALASACNRAEGNRSAFTEMLIQCLISVLFVIVSTYSANDNVSYKFVEFSYKDTKINGIAYKEFESACEQTPMCTLKTGTARTACVRECISPSCYQELYAHDPLEEGEIDVRLNSFKGCFIQRLGLLRQ